MGSHARTNVNVDGFPTAAEFYVISDSHAFIDYAIFEPQIRAILDDYKSAPMALMQKVTNTQNTKSFWSKVVSQWSSNLMLVITKAPSRLHEITLYYGQNDNDPSLDTYAHKIFKGYTLDPTVALLYARMKNAHGRRRLWRVKASPEVPVLFHGGLTPATRGYKDTSECIVPAGYQVVMERSEHHEYTDENGKMHEIEIIDAHLEPSRSEGSTAEERNALSAGACSTHVNPYLLRQASV